MITRTEGAESLADYAARPAPGHSPRSGRGHRLKYSAPGRGTKYYFLRPSIILICSRMKSVIGVVDSLGFTATGLTVTGFRAFLAFFKAGFLDLAVIFFLTTAFFMEADFGFVVALRLGVDFFFS